jgi:hypothetical protein
MGNGNVFSLGSVAASPNLHQVFAPNNTLGLEDALTLVTLSIDIPTTLGRIQSDLLDPARANRPSYLDATAAPLELPRRSVRTQDIQQGRVHTHSCAGNQTLSLESFSALRNIAIVTNCRVDIGDDTTLENVVLLTTNTHQSSINVGEGSILGKMDNCAPGNQAQLLTYGGMQVGHYAEFHGSHLVANGALQAGQQTVNVGSLLLSGTNLTTQGEMTTSACGTGGHVQTTWWDSLLAFFRI